MARTGVARRPRSRTPRPDSGHYGRDCGRSGLSRPPLRPVAPLPLPPAVGARHARPGSVRPREAEPPAVGRGRVLAPRPRAVGRGCDARGGAVPGRHPRPVVLPGGGLPRPNADSNRLCPPRRRGGSVPCVLPLPFLPASAAQRQRFCQPRCLVTPRCVVRFPACRGPGAAGPAGPAPRVDGCNSRRDRVCVSLPPGKQASARPAAKPSFRCHRLLTVRALRGADRRPCAQVRIMVAALARVGAGTWSAQYLADTLQVRPRRRRRKLGACCADAHAAAVFVSRAGSVADPDPGDGACLRPVSVQGRL